MGPWGADCGTGRRGLRIRGAPRGVAVGVRRAEGVRPGIEGDISLWASAAADRAILRHSSSVDIQTFYITVGKTH